VSDSWACKRSVSGSENRAQRAENRVEWARAAWSGYGRKRWSGSGARSGRLRSGDGAGSRLNRPLTARSNLTFHSTLYITYIVRIELSAVYSFSIHFFTLHALACHFCSNLAQPITQLKAFLTRSNPSRLGPDLA